MRKEETKERKDERNYLPELANRRERRIVFVCECVCVCVCVCMCMCVYVCVSRKSYGSNVRLSPAWSEGWSMSDTCCLGEKKLSYALRE